MDYALFKALTGPLANAGLIQQQREQNQMRQLQMQQQQQQIQLQQANKNKALQDMLIEASKAAQNDLYTKNNFSRQKDIDDFRNWHNELSGWSDIQGVLRQYGSVDNARLYGNLDYLLAEYQHRIQNNPISKRVNKNKASLERFHAYALDKDGNAQFLTKGSKERYNNYLKGKTDNFVFNGGRADYLDVAQKGQQINQQVDIESLIYGSDTRNAILADMYMDTNLDPTQHSFTDDDMRNFLRRELNVTTLDGVDYFGGKALFGMKEIDTNASVEIQKLLESSGSFTGKEFFNTFNLDKGLTYDKYFTKQGLDQGWSQFGGVDNSKTTYDYSDDYYGFLTKGRKIASSSRVFADSEIERKLSKAVFGKIDDKTYSYNPSDRTVDNVQMTNMFDSRGRKILSEDTDGGTEGVQGFRGDGFEDFFGEDAVMDDLVLEGYFVGYRGKSADGKDILLTDVTNEDDRKKMANEYKNVVFKPVLIAELRDDDMISADDHYYKVVRLEDMNVQMAINKQIDTEDMEEVLTDQANYEERRANNKMIAAKRAAGELRLQKALGQPDEKSVSDIVNGYDQQLTVGLSMASVPSVQIQQAVPLIMADLYLDSQQERTYPFDFTPNEQDPNKKRIANNPGEYMAYSTMALKEGLLSGGQGYSAMLEAIRTGNYNKFSRTLYSESDFQKRRNLSKQIIKYQRSR